MKIEIAGKLSYAQQPYIERAVSQAIADMPDGVRNTLSEVKVILANALINIYPDAAHTLLKGHSSKTIGYSYGAYDSDRNTINLAQTRMIDEHVIKRDRVGDFHDIMDTCLTGAPDDFEISSRYDVVRSNLYGVFLHEAGHAFDNAGGRYSHSAEMQEAYDEDIAALQQMNLDEKYSLLARHAHYFSSRTFNQAGQPSDQDARQEVFAEAFAKIIGGMKNSGDPEHAEEHKSIFAHCYALIEQTILRIAPNAVLYPTHERTFDYYESKEIERERPRTTATSFTTAAGTNFPPANFKIIGGDFYKDVRSQDMRIIKPLTFNP